MYEILVVRNPTDAQIDALGAREWPIWTKEVSVFDWEYDEPETCLFLEGEVIVTPTNGGAPAHVQAGDLVTFPVGLKCTWKVIRPVRKHYRFG